MSFIRKSRLIRWFKAWRWIICTKHRYLQIAFSSNFLVAPRSCSFIHEFACKHQTENQLRCTSNVFPLTFCLGRKRFLIIHLLFFQFCFLNFVLRSQSNDSQANNVVFMFLFLLTPPHGLSSTSVSISSSPSHLIWLDSFIHYFTSGRLGTHPHFSRFLCSIICSPPFIRQLFIYLVLFFSWFDIFISMWLYFVQLIKSP